MKTCEQCHLRYPNESTFCFVDGKPRHPEAPWVFWDFVRYNFLPTRRRSGA